MTRVTVLAAAAAATLTTALVLFGAPTVAADAASADPHPEPAAPVPPAEAAGRMTLPEGFKATLFAGEPDVVQPIAFTIDDRGRLWVCEGMSYPRWQEEDTEPQ